MNEVMKYSFKVLSVDDYLQNMIFFLAYLSRSLWMSIDVVILNEKNFYHIFTELGINNSFNEVQLSSSLLNDDINASNLSFESKNATKNTKLARIRSFKDDFLEKISLMRTPMNTSTLTRFVLIKIIFIFL